MSRCACRWTVLVLIAAGAVAGAQPAPALPPAPRAPTPVVDEPLGARYSLGMTLWHMGHSAEMIRRFHEFVRQEGLAPAQLLPAAAQAHPATVQRVLVDPELLPASALNGWQARDGCVVSTALDAGPTLSFPLHVPRSGLYRLWVRYLARPGCRGVTSLAIYRTGEDALGPLCQPDEVYDESPAQAGPAWHDLLVDLAAGDYTIRLGHVTRWWHGPGGYDQRQIDCLYLTDELWAEAPAADQLQAMRGQTPPEGIQWAATAPLGVADREAWLWWQVRPLSWEAAATNPPLFALSRRFWEATVADLATRDYPEAKDKLPDYRAPERQVVFNETWNLVANPVRARRQIETLAADVQTAPLPYHYVWHDVPGNIPGLTAAERPPAYGGWTFYQNCLFASYGSPTGTVTTEVPVRHPGRYSVWVLSERTNLSYTAPWFGTVSVDGKEQFKYHHAGKIPSLWMKMGEAVVDKPGPVTVEFTLDAAGAGGTYRRIYTLFLVDDPAFVPAGTVRPPWTEEMFRERAAQAGAAPTDRYLVWLPDNPSTPLSQEVWADRTGAGRFWPDTPVSGTASHASLLLARDTRRAVQVCLVNLTPQPLPLAVHTDGLRGAAGTFPAALTWRVVAFAPYGPDRQQWSPFFLLRRPRVTVPPLHSAALWLTVDARGLAPGEYAGTVRLGGEGAEQRTVELRVRISPVAAQPTQPVLVDGYTRPHEGEAYLRDYVDHGMNVWRGLLSKEEMRRWGIRLQAISMGSAADLARVKAAGLDYDDWFAVIRDEPCGKTEEELKPFLDVARALKAADPQVRISFNPGEAATLATFQVLAPWCDVWLPYSLHLSPHWGGPEKWAIYKARPWMWYTTPCLGDKDPNLPNQIAAQIRQVPGQTGKCVGTAFFALSYPFRDQWDTAYEYLPDASTMGAVMSRHGPVATRTWEAIGEATQHANLAMLVRERLGVATFDGIKDPAIQRLVAAGTSDELIGWLQEHPTP